MNCRKVRPYLSGYYDQDFPEKEDVGEHLEECPGCGLEALEFSKISEMVKNIKMLEPSFDFNEKLLAKIKQAPYQQKNIKEPEPKTSFPLRWALVGSLGVLLVVLISIIDRFDLFKSKGKMLTQKEETISTEEQIFGTKPTFFVMDNINPTQFDTKDGGRISKKNLSQFVMESVSPRFQRGDGFIVLTSEGGSFKNGTDSRTDYFVLPVVSTQTTKVKRSF
jgi:hypothetical protein